MHSIIIPLYTKCYSYIFINKNKKFKSDYYDLNIRSPQPK